MKDLLEVEAIEEARNISLYAASEACIEKELKQLEEDFKTTYGKHWKEILSLYHY